MVGANIAPKLIGLGIQLISPRRCTFRRNSTWEVAILMQFSGANCLSFDRGFASASCRHWQQSPRGLGRCRATPNGKVTSGHAKSPLPNQIASDSYSTWSARHSCKLARSHRTTFFNTCFFRVALYIVESLGVKDAMRSICCNSRNMVTANPTRNSQATRARVLNSSAPSKLLPCQIHWQLLLVDRCHAVYTAITHRSPPCWAR